MFCRTCWANLPDGTRVCPRCGADPASPSGKVTTGPRRRSRPPEKKSSITAFLSTLVILSLISGTVYYIHTRSPRVDEEKAPEFTPLEVKETPQGPVFSEALPYKPEIKVPEVYEEGTTTANEAVRAFNDGDWPEAVRLFGEALTDSPDDEILKHNLAHSLASMALQEYKDEDFSGAGRHFTEAIGLEKNPTFYKWLAYARLKQDDLEGAAAALEEIKTDPEAKGLLKSIYSNLGDQHYRSGELDEAIGYFERGLAIDPGDKGIKQALRRLRGENEVEAGFRTREGSHFVVRFEGGVNSVTGNVIAILLEEAYFKVGADLGYYPDETVGAVLYSSEEFRDTTRSPTWVGALYDGRIKIPAGGITERTDVLEKVIFHEYTHAVVHRLSGGNAPVWLNEGIAQYEEGKRASSYERIIKDSVSTRKVSLRALEGSFMRLMDNDVASAYALSLSATEYIINEFGPFSVKTILEGLSEGYGLDEAISSAIYIPYDVLEESWLTSLRR